MRTFAPIRSYFIALLLFGFSGAAESPSDLTVTYETSNGTVAPQFYEVRRITIRSAGDSEFLLTRGTDSTGKTESRTAFAPDPQKLKLLLNYIRAKHFDSPPSAAQALRTPRRPGEGRCSLKFVFRGNAYGVPCDAPDVAILLDMLREMVPPSAR